MRGLRFSESDDSVEVAAGGGTDNIKQNENKTQSSKRLKEENDDDPNMKGEKRFCNNNVTEFKPVE